MTPSHTGPVTNYVDPNEPFLDARLWKEGKPAGKLTFRGKYPGVISLLLLLRLGFLLLCLLLLLLRCAASQLRRTLFARPPTTTTTTVLHLTRNRIRACDRGQAY